MCINLCRISLHSSLTPVGLRVGVELKRFFVAHLKNAKRKCFLVHSSRWDGLRNYTLPIVKDIFRISSFFSIRMHSIWSHAANHCHIPIFCILYSGREDVIQCEENSSLSGMGLNVSRRRIGSSMSPLVLVTDSDWILHHHLKFKTM